MKLLYVSGDEYSAMNFENSELTIAEGVEIALSDNNWYIEGFCAKFKIYEFKGSVDEEFISFLKNNLLDYDQLKHENFYIID